MGGRLIGHNVILNQLSVMAKAARSAQQSCRVPGANSRGRTGQREDGQIAAGRGRSMSPMRKGVLGRIIKGTDGY